MRLSFLIPSKNRLELLRFTVESILRQGYSDFEIIISDNASNQDYSAFVSNLNDGRIRYHRASKPVSVTENWNNALTLACGDYVLMLGDDDALTPWFASHVTRLLDSAREPDIVYFASYHYCYPGVMPREPKGYLADVRNSRFFKDRSGPFELPLEEARMVAKGAFDFRYLFGFNSQHFLFRGDFVKSMESLGGLFQSPYPDTFSAVASFLNANSIVVIPEPMVMIGISPKSFGYYYFNKIATEGYEFLDSEQVSKDIRKALEHAVIPGDTNNTNWLISVEAARRALAPDRALEVNIERYRLLQMIAFLQDIYLNKTRQAGERTQFQALLNDFEREVFGLLCAAVEFSDDDQNGCAKLFDAFRRQLGQFWPAQVSMLDIGEHSNILDAYDWLAQNQSRLFPSEG
jgi:glycosyltransferase involved in cell wall biosynthesis